MYRLVKPLLIREKLLEQKIHSFNNREFAHTFDLSPYQAEYQLAELIKENLLTRLKRGLYVLKTDPPTEEEIANVLYKPSYVSFEYALAYHNILPEMTYHVTSATTKPTRLFTVGHTSFAYYTIKAEAYTGYVLAQRQKSYFYIAEPEKALVDYLYSVSMGDRSLLGIRSLNERMNLSFLKKEKILSYAKLYHWQKLDKLLKKLL